MTAPEGAQRGGTSRHVFADVGDAAHELVRRFEQAARRSIEARGLFTVALTGGSAASSTYPRLIQASVDWQRVHVFFGDERAVAPDDKDSNYKLAHDALLSRVALPAENIHRIRGEDADIDAAARAYEDELVRITGEGTLDVVHLGMGPDGHVCSLFPGHALLAESVRLVRAVKDSPKPPSSRITLTLPTLARARELWFLVFGAGKADAVADVVLDIDCPLPAARAARAAHAAHWLLDGDAARLLEAHAGRMKTTPSR